MSDVRPAYSSLPRHEPGPDRPWTAINMVTTIDGKILSGARDEHVMDLGSKTDHATMRMIESAHDAVMIGAGSLRATPGLWYDKSLLRLVVSGSGRLDFNSRFFTDSPDRAWVVTTTRGARALPKHIRCVDGGEVVAWSLVMSHLMADLGVRRLLVEGGSELNASLLREDIVDELFWTIAPKVKLGRDTPTYADGEPLDRAGILNFELAEHHKVGDELFLRYLRRR